MHLIFKRILAWIIDWVLIILYACLLFGTMMILASLGIVKLEELHPVQGQLIGFLTLTLPVVLYFILFEIGRSHATPGKRAMKIEVIGTPLTTGQIILRNVIKFLPWELAHAGILWINYINSPETPLWIWFLLIGPQVVVIVYFMTMVATKGSRSLYDLLAKTRVRHLTTHLPLIIFCSFVF